MDKIWFNQCQNSKMAYLVVRVYCIKLFGCAIISCVNICSLHNIYSKEPKIIHQLRKKRSILCNLIDELTLDYRIDFPGFDWSKKVGNDFIGASFGVKMINFAHMHLC